MRYCGLHRLSLPFLAFALIGAGPSGEKISWAPKVGDLHSYRYRVDFEHVPDMDGSSGDVTLRWRLASKIKEIRKDGRVVIEHTVTSVESTLDEPTDAKADSALKSVRALLPNGEPSADSKEDSKAQDDDAAADFVQWIPEMHYPSELIKEGDEWKFTTDGDGTEESPKVRMYYDYTGREKVHDVDCYKIDVESRQVEPASDTKTTGTIWVSVTDGTLMEADIKVKNLRFDPSGSPSNVEVSVINED